MNNFDCELLLSNEKPTQLIIEHQFIGIKKSKKDYVKRESTNLYSANIVYQVENDSTIDTKYKNINYMEIIFKKKYFQFTTLNTSNLIVNSVHFSNKLLIPIIDYTTTKNEENSTIYIKIDNLENLPKDQDIVEYEIIFQNIFYSIEQYTFSFKIFNNYIQTESISIFQLELRKQELELEESNNNNSNKDYSNNNSNNNNNNNNNNDNDDDNNNNYINNNNNNLSIRNNNNNNNLNINTLFDISEIINPDINYNEIYVIIIYEDEQQQIESLKTTNEFQASDSVYVIDKVKNLTIVFENPIVKFIEFYTNNIENANIVNILQRKVLSQYKLDKDLNSITFDNFPIEENETIILGFKYISTNNIEVTIMFTVKRIKEEF